MKKHKRIASIMMTFALLMTLLPFSGITAKAADDLLQIGSTTYETWAAAISAVQAGQTITLRKDVTLTDSDIMPAVACTIYGSANKYTLTFCQAIHLNADITLKDLNIGDKQNGETIIYGNNLSTGYETTLTIEGTVSSAANDVNSIRFRAGGELIVNGTLKCYDVSDYDKLTVNTGASLEAYDYICANDALIDGTATVGRYYFSVGGATLSGNGLLSGTGAIIFNAKNSYGSNLQFYKCGVDNDCRITINASYSPTAGEQLICNTYSATPVSNIDRLTLGGNYSSFKLNGAASGSTYCYSLAASTGKSALTQASMTLAPDNANGGLSYTISDPVSGEASGISCYCIMLYNSTGTAQAGSRIYTVSVSGNIPTSVQLPGGVGYTATVQALSKITSDYTASAVSGLCAAATAAKSGNKAITAFTIGTVTAAINSDDTITAEMPYGTNLTALKPTVTVSDMASVSPASGSAANFTNPVQYAVTAEDGTTRTYTVTVTVSTAPILQIGSSKYGTWAQAAAAAKSGDTIMLLGNVTILSGDVMPSVACTIDGGPSRYTLTLSSDQHLLADTALRDLKLTYSGADNVTLICGYHNVTISGTVDVSNIIIANAGELNIGGTFNADSIELVDQLIVASGAKLNTFSAEYIDNAEINGTVTCKYLDLIKESGGDSGSTGSGLLFGTGTIIFTTPGGEGANLWISNVLIDSAALIKVDASGYTPSANDIVIGYKGTSPLNNVDRLTLGSGYAGFKLSGEAFSSEYDYSLAASTTAPNRKTGIAATTSASVTVNSAYTLDLLSIFEDAENDALTFKVSVNGASAVAADENYSYTPTAAGTTTLEFTANDGTTNSTDTYKVTLTATSANSNPGTGTGGGTISSAPPVTTSTTGTGSSAVTTASASIPGTTSGGALTVSVPKDTMSALTAAAEKAKAAGGQAIASVDTGSGSGIASIGVTIPGAQFSSFASDTSASFRVGTSLGSVTFSSGAVDAIGVAGSGDVSFGIGIVSASSLSAAQQQAVGDRLIYSFSVTIGGTAVSQFGSGVTVSIPYTLGANENPNAVVIYYLDASGTLQPMQGKYDVETKTVTFFTTHFSDYVIGYNKVSFNDVDSGAWYADAVTFLAARGVTSGTSDGVFSPDATLTRGQFITLLMRAYGISPDTSSTDNFSDAGNTYYTGYLAAAKSHSITNGIGNNKFAPDQAITRQEMFTLLYNALKTFDKLPTGTSGKMLTDFTDSVVVASWADGAMTVLVKLGMLSGSGGKLLPTATTTRAEMAQVLYNLLGK